VEPNSLGVTASGSGKNKSTTKSKGSGKRKTSEPPTPRAPNWAAGELKLFLTVAPTHWASTRGSRTGEKSRRTIEEVIADFVAATPAENRPVARMRRTTALDR